MTIGLMIQDSELQYQDYGPLQGPVNRLACLHHYFCPQCGLEWAFFYDDEAGKSHRHMVSHVLCPEHGGGSLISAGFKGRFSTTIYPLDLLPMEALVREIQIILDAKENYNDFFGYTDDHSKRRRFTNV